MSDRSTEKGVNALLDDYDPSLGLVARGVMQGEDDHDPESCEASCCVSAATERERSAR